MSVQKSKVPRQQLRVLKRTMVYCSGIPSNLTQDELTSESYFGQYGKIEKIIINPYPNKNYCSLYITYSHEFQAATAILSCNQYQIGRSTLWCLFGTMKYCRFFLKKIQCKNLPNCPYLHILDKKHEIQINNSPSEAFPEHQVIAKEVYQKYPDFIKQIEKENKPDGELPSPTQSLYHFQQNNPLQQKENREKKQKEPNQQDQRKQQTGTHQKDLEMIIKRMLLRQLERSKGSRLFRTIVSEEQNVRKIMISGLRE